MSDFKWLPKNSEMAKLVREFDWPSTPLGPLDHWSESLKSTTALIMASKFPMFLWIGKNFINIYNDAYAIIAGPSKHPRFFGEPARNMWSEIWETVGDFAATVVTSGESLSFQDLPLTLVREGKRVEAYFTFSYSPLFEADGSINGLLGVVHETTEQVVSRRQIEFERKKLSDIFMNSPIAFARLRGPDHVFDQFNTVFNELLGNRDILGKTVRTALPEFEGQGFFELLDGVFSSGERYVSPESKVVIYRGGKLEPRFVSFIYEPEKDLSGKVTGIIAIAIDVTTIVDARLAEEAHSNVLKQALEDRDTSLKKLSTINRIGLQLTATLDLKELVQTITDAGVEISGAQFGAFFYTSMDEAGKELLLYTVSGAPVEAFSKFPNPRATAVFNPTFMGLGTVLSDDITKDPRYGKNAPYHGLPEGHLPVKSYLAVSVIARTGEVIGGLFFGHSSAGVFTPETAEVIEGIASQTAVAMDNARLYQNLKKSLHARDEFLSIASHELKTPLTSLVLQAQMRNRLLNTGEFTGVNMEKLKSMTAIDQRQLQRLSRLVDDMLDISRLQTGKLSLERVEVDLCQIVKEVVERFHQQFADAKVSYTVDACEQTPVFVDPFRIEQVVVNLLTNALKYGDHRPVELKLQADANFVSLKVIDHGRGIKTQDQSRIFKRFERAVSHSEVSGLGLGLAIAKEIIEDHGGTITVVSELGKGSVFEVRLPLFKGSTS